MSLPSSDCDHVDAVVTGLGVASVCISPKTSVNIVWEYEMSRLVRLFAIVDIHRSRYKIMEVPHLHLRNRQDLNRMPPSLVVREEFS